MTFPFQPMQTLPHQPVIPSIQNRRQLDAAVENIVQLQLQRAELETAQENEIAAIRQKYRAPLAEVERYLLLETSWVETWARNNPGAFDATRALACPHARIGFHTPPPRVERASRKWTWSAIVVKLGETAWGKRYLRSPAPEVNKEAILADRTHLPAEELRLAGIKIIQQERFFITPHGAAENLPAEQPDWQEAA
jgi:phage host-nuclease inhibitor protein Gam